MRNARPDAAQKRAAMRPRDASRSSGAGAPRWTGRRLARVGRRAPTEPGGASRRAGSAPRCVRTAPREDAEVRPDGTGRRPARAEVRPDGTRTDREESRRERRGQRGQKRCPALRVPNLNPLRALRSLRLSLSRAVRDGSSVPSGPGWSAAGAAPSRPPRRTTRLRCPSAGRRGWARTSPATSSSTASAVSSGERGLRGALAVGQRHAAHGLLDLRDGRGLHRQLAQAEAEEQHRGERIARHRAAERDRAPRAPPPRARPAGSSGGWPGGTARRGERASGCPGRSRACTG